MIGFSNLATEDRPTIRRTQLEEDIMEREQPREDGAVAEDPARERSGAKPAEVRRVAEAVLDGPGPSTFTFPRIRWVVVSPA